MSDKPFLNFFKQSYEQRYEPDSSEDVIGVDKSELIRGISPDKLAVVLVRPGIDFESEFGEGDFFIAFIHYKPSSTDGDSPEGLRRRYLIGESPEGREDVAEVISDDPVTIRELGQGEREDIYRLLTETEFI